MLVLYVCQFYFSFFSRTHSPLKCKEYIETYTPKLIDLLNYEVNPAVICSVRKRNKLMLFLFVNSVFNMSLVYLVMAPISLVGKLLFIIS